MRKLITATKGIRPWIHESEDAVSPVGRNNDQHGKSDNQHDNQDGKQTGAHAAQEENADGDRNDDDESSEIRLLEQQHANRNHGPGHRQECLFQVMHVRHLAYRVVGGIQHGEQLHQLGRLQIDDAERQPAARAIDFATDTRNQHQCQQHEAGDKKPGRQMLPGS